MNSGLYSACAGLVGRMQALDTIAANVANSSSAGFRGQKEVFGSVLAQAAGHTRLSTLNRATNSFSNVGQAQLDETQGAISRTDNDLDLAIQGEGYFKLQTTTGVAYTRNGHFQTDAKGQLTTATGDLVLGESDPISVGSGKVTVTANGTISTNGSLSGKLAIVTFAPGTVLNGRGGGDYVAPVSAERTSPSATIQQGALEGSNVSSMEGMVQLISAQRAAESMRHVLSMLDGEMDKTAVQDLARVS